MPAPILRDGFPFIPYQPPSVSIDDARARGVALVEELGARRSVRAFRNDPVPRDLIELAIRAAGTAPSGAHRQPWHFVAIADPGTKSRIRAAAEAEERLNYDGRMPPDWIEALRPLGTDAVKPYLDVAPWLVAVFAENHGPEGSHRKNYYVKESVGIACGLFIAALQRMGLATLTHTPSPMRFLSEILGRPAHEQPYILFPIGWPAPDCLVPDIARKSLDDIASWVDVP